MARLCLFFRHQRIIQKNLRTQNPVFYCMIKSFNTQIKCNNHVYTKWNNNNKVQLNNIQHYSSALRINHENIFKSAIPDIPNYHGIFLHEFIWRNMQKWWDKTALVCAMTGRSYTYEQLKRLSGRLATFLRKHNLRPGDTIAAILPNVPEYAILLLGASEAGLQVTLINPIYTSKEIEKQLINSETVAIITTVSKYPVVAESIVNNSAIRLPTVVVADGTGPVPSGTINFNDLISGSVEEFEKTGQKTEQNPNEDTLVLPYSSGTTGLPKGVELTHRNIVANLYQFGAKEVNISGEAIGNHQEIVPLFLPIYHIYGLVCILYYYLSIGAKIICMPQFSSTALLEVLEKNKTTLLYVAPPIIQLLVNEERFTTSHIENVKLLMSGAAPMGEEMIDKFRTKCKIPIEIVQGYGLTETSPVISKSKKAPLASSGLILSNTELRIVGCDDENKNKNLGVNEVGEIFVKGPQVMKGYYKNPQATQECMEGEWFKTGDLGLIDDQGFLYIKGRLKELIKVQGYQVAPAELEDVILGHEKVADVAVIGVPHERYGEIPKAFIVPKPNMRIDEQELKEFVAKRVAKYKNLGNVAIIDKIPKSPAGKILRRILQQM
ncbi:4-coumarate--CoA ligase 1-like [Chelonus insularis]|uniref:4-coumarate--CoA ligase 1-like n=1 Tax=Chelonus insularis TaxID=460826 RepID=UPI00158B43E4|nr:4-coumarate--CoA ligase 1-like [Chelonus insularis]